MEVELGWLWMVLITSVGVYIVVFGIVRNINQWVYVERVKHKLAYPLPPGHMGWPLLGNFLSLLTAFKSSNPESFINNLISRYGESGIYKSHMFGSPSVMVCKAELCRKVLTDDQQFKIGYPQALWKLVGNRTFNSDSVAHHKRIRRLTTSPIVGHASLALYVQGIEDIMVNALEEWASMSTRGPLQLLNELKHLTFKVIVHVLMGSHNNLSISQIADFYNHVLHGLFAFPINFPGFAYHKALKARRKLLRIIQCVVKERRMMKKTTDEKEGNKDLLAILLEGQDENGQKLEDEEIVDLLVGFLFAGHETSAHAMMWSIIYLTNHPHIMDKAKKEQEEILKRRQQDQKGLNLHEIKQMVFLAKVVNETLRQANITFSIFREAKVDVNINGYSIPKGWKVIVWLRALHFDPEYYTDPQQFNPSRWDVSVKPGSYLPFGVGMRLCPGLDLVTLEMSIFLHYFLLHYK
ncbi:beta-amyrin 11-oxidase-like [Senna tora]|uniref:Beta-amyrin 11-oxidase-like n=1 Tax=Senna tora TaxID=362788 RepID=A0A834WR06_9FABA|nr:beta-amyrin 11-oxidase-like [Senna tora]